jgi:hypothetical protein
MNNNILKESLDKFVSPVYSRVDRTAATYTTVARYSASNLTRLVEEYKTVTNDRQLMREIRNDIDYHLRRYHKYCIEERDGIKAHYYEVGANDDCDFEHLIPAARIRDLLLSGSITTEQALNAPTVRLSRDKHVALKDAGWASKTPNMWKPFERYTNVFEATYTTYDGTVIDATTWTLDKHFEYFKHLVILV